MSEIISNGLFKLNKLLDEVKNEIEFEKIILNKCILEFEERIPSILIQSDSEFMKNFSIRMKLLLMDEYSEDAFENDFLSNLLKQSEKKIYDKFYKPIKNLLLNSLNDYDSRNYELKFKQTQSNTYLTNNFRKHCLSCDDLAFHSCGGKFIPVFANYGHCLDNDNLINKIPKDGLKIIQNTNFESLCFVICVKCRKSFLSKEILMYCNSCNLNYLSTTLKQEDILLQPATWENYHCEALLNDTMKCIKCKSMIFINIETKNLECRKCEFKCDPWTIIWKCFLCSSDFNSNAKIYNPLEFLAVNKAIKNAILDKMLIYPIQIPCCKIEIPRTRFFHKIECNGILYEGRYDDQTIIVCDKCKAMNFYFRFIWTCPKCHKRFSQKKLLIERAFRDSNSETFNSEVPTFRTFGGKLDLNHLHSNNEDLDLIKKNSSRNKSDIHVSKKALNYYKNENTKGNSILKYTKMINNVKVGNDGEKNEDINNNINILTTVANLETETGETELDENKKSNKNSKTIHEKAPKADFEKGIIRPRRNLTPIIERKNKKTAEEEKSNKEFLNPFKHDKSLIIDNKKNFIKKKEFERTTRTNRMTIFNVSPKSIKIKKNDFNDETEDKFIQKRKKKNINIQIQSDSFVDQDHNDIDALKDNINGNFKVKEFDKNENEFTEEDNNSINDNFLPMFVVEDYKFINQIGTGILSSIHQCIDNNDERFAIKKIIIKDKEKIDEICNELEQTYQMKHKNILEINGISKRKLDPNSEIIYVLMELGRYDWKYDIRLRMRDNRYYTEKELISIVGQIIDALAYFQSKNLAHRNVKPENIIFFRNNLYKISDFGSAKEVLINSNEDSPNELFTSPAIYEALNNKTNLKDLNHNVIKSDVYSLGLCLLYAANLSIDPIDDIRNILDQIWFYNYLKKCLKSYSQEFLILVYRMLDLNEELRFDFLDLKTYLNKI